MEACTTFLRADSDKHLWIVISDPTADPDQVLIVNLTTVDERKEQVCLLHGGEHPWIRHETCVNYADDVVTTDIVHLSDAGSKFLVKTIKGSLFLAP
jgi:hypothetical protein